MSEYALILEEFEYYQGVSDFTENNQILPLLSVRLGFYFVMRLYNIYSLADNIITVKSSLQC